VEITSEAMIPSLSVFSMVFKWPQRNLCIADVGYRTVPWRERRGIKVKKLWTAEWPHNSKD